MVSLGPPMPSLLPRHRADRHLPPAPAVRRPRLQRLRMALLGGPLLVIAGAAVAAPALAPATPGVPDGIAAARPTPSLTLAASLEPSPAATAAATPSPTPMVAPTATPPGPTSKPPSRLDGYVWPLRNARLTSRFGQRDDGGMIVDGERYHDGIDLATWCGDKVRAAHSGTVLYAGRKFDEHTGYSGPMDSFYARMEQIGGLVRWLPIVVVIDDGNGYRSLYAHLSRASVEAGDVVTAGQVIGLEGATGRATGCHLHYALIRMDGPWIPVEPTFVQKLRYPPFVRERVDPLLVFPHADAYAPGKLQRAARISEWLARIRSGGDRLPTIVEPD